MKKEILINPIAPKAIGLYSSALKANGFIFVAGQLPVDPTTDELIEGDIGAQTKMSLENLKTVIEPYGIDLNDVVKITIFLKDMNNFTRVNNTYSEYFTEKFPARSCI
ncbi:MAG TPA: Rid family detoxifying hydrolase [Atribacterota bacterium]|nr:Rid family detoxifying hydrolase [Atribacterota bacterium]